MLPIDRWWSCDTKTQHSSTWVQSSTHYVTMFVPVIYFTPGTWIGCSLEQVAEEDYFFLSFWSRLKPEEGEWHNLIEWKRTVCESHVPAFHNSLICSWRGWMFTTPAKAEEDAEGSEKSSHGSRAIQISEWMTGVLPLGTFDQRFSLGLVPYFS